MATERTIQSKSFAESLVDIQQRLNAPKGQRNNFGNYNYRSCEDILEAVKPLLKEHGFLLLIKDTVCQIGDRYYVEATASVSNGIESTQVTAYAREEETKKGMDGAQITGAASSYARKYALNGLFAIDDTKDADTQDNRPKATAQSSGQTKSQNSRTQATVTTTTTSGNKTYSNPEAPASDKQKQLIATKLKEQGVVSEDMSGYIMEQWGADAKKMTMEQASSIIEDLIS